MKLRILTTTIALIGICHAAPAWSDFDQKPAAEQWQSRGKATLLDEPVAANAPAGGPKGKALRVKADGRALIASRADNHPITGVNDAEEVSFWIQRAAEETAPLVLDVLFLEKDLRAAMWRKLEVTEPGWQKVTLPLAWFRWETGRVPRWSEMKHFAFRTRGPADFAVDDITFTDKDPAVGAEYSVEQLSELAFGKNNQNARKRTTDKLWILTDHPELDLEQLGKHLESVLEKVQPELKVQETPERPARIIVFSDEESYRGFVPRFGERLGATAPRPQSDGYHLQGIALSYWKPELGTLRPVFTHEFVHSILSNYALTDSAHSDWWQEGVASTYQLRSHPQEDFAPMVRKSLANPSARMTLEELCTGGDIPLTRYWQAATLVEMLIGHPEYSDKLGKLTDAFRKTGSTDMRPLIQPVYGKSWEELTTDWMSWCTEHYPAGPAIVPAEGGGLQ
jgi:hypothetical protein